MEQFIKIRKASRKNQAWAVGRAILDLDGKPVVTLVIDVYTRHPLSATVSPRRSKAITKGLDQLVQSSSERPEAIWVDYIHDHASFPFMRWAEKHGMTLVYGVPPRMNTFTRAVLRDLGAHLQNKPFPTLMELDHEIERWRQTYTPAARIAPEVNQ